MEMKEQFMPPQAINSQPTGKNILSVFFLFSNIQFVASISTYGHKIITRCFNNHYILTKGTIIIYSMKN